MNTPTMALGCMYFGTTVQERTAFAILDRYVELGGRWLDTSDNYSFWTSETGFGGQSESLLGRWLSANPGADVLISTKVGAQPNQVGGFPHDVEGLGEAAVESALTGSLDRLGIEAVDLYWLHVEDPTVPVDRLALTFGTLAADARIGRWGISNHPSWLFERIRGSAERQGLAEPTAYQQRYSYYQPLPDEPVDGQPIPLGMLSPDGLDFLRRNPDVDGWIYTATMRGHYDRADRPLSAEYRHPGNDRRQAALAAVSAERGLQPGQVVLSWLASGNPTLTPIVGASSVEQLERAVAGVRTRLSDEELTALNEAGKQAPTPG